jgi:hypothetical protein
VSAEAPPSGRLGDWYAKIAHAGRRQLVLCVNERSLLCVVVPLASRRYFLERFLDAARARIDQIPAAPEVRVAEKAALEPIQVGRVANRSVLSSLNQFAYGIESWVAQRPADDLDALGLWLCDTPCSPLQTHWPWLEAELVLTGSVAPGRRPFKFDE